MRGVATTLQDEVNRAVYLKREVYRSYLSRSLTAAEIACLLKYQPYISGRDVLDIGVGAGRTAHFLVPLARRYEAVDYSPVMVSYLRKAMPQLSVREANFCDLSVFDDRSFDFVFAPDNVIDALSPDSRLRALREARRVLRPKGVLAFSCHNLRYRRANSAPWLDWSWNPWRLAINTVKFLLSWWNHLRVGRLRRTAADYALLNDRGHLYRCLHYYAARPAVRSQLASSGLLLLDVFDTDGRVLSETAADSDCPSLLYVARSE